MQREIDLLKKLLLYNSLLTPLDNNPEIYLSIACIAKDEGPYIKEWLESHRIVGVQRFYFYDKESSDNTREILEPYIRDGVVIYRYVTGRAMQCPVYQDAVLKVRGHTRWLAVIDLDEFIVPIEHNTVPEILKQFEAYPGVGIARLTFDYNNYLKPPTAHGGLVTANYTRVPKYPERDCRCGIKSIVNPSLVVYINNAHFFWFKSYLKFTTVSENFEQISGRTFKSDYYSARKIRINHYHDRSIEDGRKKSAKGGTWAVASAKHKKRNVYLFKNIETTNDYVIQKYLPRLKQVMGIKD